jgi:hypothetical protein
MHEAFYLILAGLGVILGPMVSVEDLIFGNIRGWSCPSWLALMLRVIGYLDCRVEVAAVEFDEF